MQANQQHIKPEMWLIRDGADNKEQRDPHDNETDESFAVYMKRYLETMGIDGQARD